MGRDYQNIVAWERSHRLTLSIQKEASLFGRTWTLLAALAPILAARHAFNPS